MFDYLPPGVFPTRFVALVAAGLTLFPLSIKDGEGEEVLADELLRLLAVR